MQDKIATCCRWLIAATALLVLPAHAQSTSDDRRNQDRVLAERVAPAQVEQPQAKEIGRECVFGDCESGYGVLEIQTTFGENIYRGYFKDGLFHGQGKLEEMISRSEKAYYDGDWAEGVRNGRGTYWDGRSNLYIGEWKDGKRHGYGSYFFGLTDWYENKHTADWLSKNTQNYSGEFMTDFYHGQGTYRWPDGRRYEGGFFANEKHGPGTFYYPRGTIRPQMWEHGKLLY